MKKFISILLTISLVFSICAVSASAAEDDGPDISYAVASDLHFNFPDEKLEWFSEDPIYGYANRRAAMENESGLIIDEFLNQCAEDETIQFVLIAGDLADNGKGDYTEHVAVAEKLQEFESKSGKSVYVVPGNHDVCNPSEDDDTDLARFMEIYADFGYDKALTRDLPYASYTADLGEKYRLIALDSNDPSKSTEDGMNDHKVQWVIDQAELAYEEGRYPILMMHHNLLDHMPMQRILSRNFIIRNHTITADQFANAGIKVVFSGHEHCSDAAVYISSQGNKIYDFATTSLTMYPLQYRVFTFNDDKIDYEARTVDSIDLDALTSTVKGYSAEQLALMEAGLNDYAKGFLKAGVEYRLALGFTMEKMGIDEDAIYYDLVNTVVGKLVNALETPLYGEGSISEQMKKYGFTIPESEYENGWDLATDLVAAHYEGEEVYPLEGEAVTILLRTVAFILREELSLLSGGTLTASADAMIADNGLTAYKPQLTEMGSTAFGGGISAAEYFIVALLSPLLYTFANDDDGVPDNNGTLEGYGTVTSKSKLDNLAEKFRSFFETIAMYFRMFMDIIAKIGQ